MLFKFFYVYLWINYSPPCRIQCIETSVIAINPLRDLNDIYLDAFFFHRIKYLRPNRKNRRTIKCFRDVGSVLMKNIRVVG